MTLPGDPLVSTTKFSPLGLVVWLATCNIYLVLLVRLKNLVFYIKISGVFVAWNNGAMETPHHGNASPRKCL